MARGECQNAPSRGSVRQHRLSSPDHLQMYDTSHTIAGPRAVAAGRKPGVEVRNSPNAKRGAESHVVAFQPKVARQPDEHVRSVTGRFSIGQSEGFGEANEFSFDPAVEVVSMPGTTPNRRRRRQQAPRERDASATVPPRAPEIERLTTPDFDPPSSSSPSSAQSFCACYTNSGEVHTYPSSRQSKLETQSKLSCSISVYRMLTVR